MAWQRPRLPAAIERRLVRDWQWVVVHAWSFRLTLLIAVIFGAEAAVPALEGLIPQRLFFVLMFSASAAAAVARLVGQSHKEGK
jgi:hypothetical protein